MNGASPAEVDGGALNRFKRKNRVGVSRVVSEFLAAFFPTVARDNVLIQPRKKKYHILNGRVSLLLLFSEIIEIMRLRGGYVETYFLFASVSFFLFFFFFLEKHPLPEKFSRSIYDAPRKRMTREDAKKDGRRRIRFDPETCRVIKNGI